jgi:hypothetical protein
VDVILDSKEVIESELKTFTENHVKFSLKRLFWLVQKIKVKYSLVPQAKTSCNQNCSIQLQTFDNRLIEISVTASDRRIALKMGLKKVYKHVQKAFQNAQNYGRLPKYAYL